MDNNTKYQEALDFLFSQLPMFSRVGAPAYKPGLETSMQLDEFFNHPHSKFKSIHIGGTNGKGSTSHSLAAILQKQGYKTALYTSPHLVDFRERIKVNGEMIPESEVVRFVEEWRKNNYPGHPSFFELTMIMAFDWFARCNVDYAVIEVGMGGRLDSTNIITPEACIITNISKDHSQFLGTTLEAIAGEKAGIIKENIPVVIGEASGVIRKVFEDKARSVSAPIVFAEDQHVITGFEETPEGKLRCIGKDFEFVFPLAGDYQKKNIATVLSAVEILKNCGIAVSDRSVKEGLEDMVSLTGLQGRWMIMNDTPLVIADTGHNIAGISCNMNQLKRLASEKKGCRIHIVIGFVADKAIDEILTLLPSEASYYITNASIPRALPADALKKKFDEAGLKGDCYPDVKAAFEAAKSQAQDSDIIYVGGSTFIVADFLS